MSDDNSQDVPMTPVRSTNVAAVGSQGNDLLVQFLSGAVYRAAGAAEHAAPMIASNSPGGYYFRHIKDRYLVTPE